MPRFVELSCPICRVLGGEHKMDCQNRAYMDQQVKIALDRRNFGPERTNAVGHKYK